MKFVYDCGYQSLPPQMPHSLQPCTQIKGELRPKAFVSALGCNKERFCVLKEKGKGDIIRNLAISAFIVLFKNF